MDKDDKYIWKNLVENTQRSQLGKITKNLHWVLDSKLLDIDQLAQLGSGNFLKSVAVRHEESFFHTKEVWDKIIPWNKRYKGPDDTHANPRYFLYEHLEGGIDPGTIVKRTAGGWKLYEIPEDLLWPVYDTSGDQIEEMNNLGAELLRYSDLEKHGYVELMASPDYARRTLRRLR